MERTRWYTPKAGDTARLSLVRDELAELADNHVRVEVKAVGLNFADIFALTGLYSATPEGGFTPGLEFSGVVVASKTSEYALGDRVMGVTRFGGYASVIDSPAAYLSPLPSGYSYQQGAAYPVQTLTAFYALRELGALKPHHSVLVNSAAGGVGLQAMQLVKAMGATAIGTVRSEAKRAFLATRGAEHILVREDDFSAQLRREGIEVDLVLDGVGGAVQKACFNALKPMGRLIVFGAAEFTPGKRRPNYFGAALKYLRRPKYDVMKMISDNRSVMAFNLIWLYENVSYLSGLMAEMQDFTTEPPHVGHEFEFTEAPAAIEMLRRGNTIGKVVLVR
ncbi:zinc-binding dehydrogenase [Umboniibacter marinipuniceus]|uniref:Alcohol dehydrogenase n=1 Tax=Umboniibacter marinipuniceus TaxID=569599 RepID=A0A3M0A8J4_9GAMM|nr:zinc-binding dehydrogenase [Umboniibacter marinipuniceus]RMA78735.1 alcohol dehydrogenase [Umboniibacter marinipuniceus]